MSLMGPEDWFAEVEGSTPLRAAGRVVPYAQVGIRDEAGNSQPPDGISCKEDATCLEHSARQRITPLVRPTNLSSLSVERDFVLCQRSDNG